MGHPSLPRRFARMERVGRVGSLQGAVTVSFEGIKMRRFLGALANGWPSNFGDGNVLGSGNIIDQYRITPIVPTV